VYLSGEGFSKSVKTLKTIFSFANEIVTKVVGTSFKIKAYANQPNVEVVVRTGKVKVRSNELISNQRPTDCFVTESSLCDFEKLTFNKITDITQDESLSRSKVI
jgi:hypothetical protein